MFSVCLSVHQGSTQVPGPFLDFGPRSFLGNEKGVPHSPGTGPVKIPVRGLAKGEEGVRQSGPGCGREYPGPDWGNTFALPRTAHATDRIRRGRYASCAHAGGLSCGLCKFRLFCTSKCHILLQNILGNIYFSKAVT